MRNSKDETDQDRNNGPPSFPRRHSCPLDWEAKLAILGVSLMILGFIGGAIQVTQ